jgi:hypothetical protein
MILEFKRWPERDGKGFSWWVIKRKDGDKISFPQAKTIKQVFRKRCPGVSFLVRENNRYEKHFFVGMQIGLTKANRETFLKILEEEMGL